MRQRNLIDNIPGDLLEDVYVVTNKQLAATAQGKHYIKAFVSDRTTQLPARMWNATRDIFNAMPDGGFLRLRGRVENYQNNLQIIIEQMWPAKAGTFEVGDLIPHTRKNISQMCTRLHELLGSIQNRHVAAIVQVFVDDEFIMGNLCKAPAAESFHHAFIGGLLEHTLNAMEVADAIIRFYPGLSRDLILAGIFLHDIGKTWELTYETSFGYSDGGRLVGHIVKAAMWVESKATEAEKILGEPIPRNVIDVLQHIILSHHGQVEFGAVKVPATPEAIVVHMVENLDAKMMMSLSATREDEENQGTWTDFMKAFGGRLYRPDVAPAEIEEPSEDSPPAGDDTVSSGADKPLESAAEVLIRNPLFGHIPPAKP